jgi:phospholipid transport system substrate-binding protein
MVLVALIAPDHRAHANEKATQASKFIEGLAGEAVNALTAANVSPEEREQRFKTMLNEYFAVTTIGQWVLGRHWARATAEERREYLKLFEEMIVVTYLNRFKRYSGESLSVTRTLVDDQSGDAMVFSQIQRPSGSEPLDIAWRLRPRGDSFKIVDVSVEGVSMSQTQRKEFASVIRRNGGQIEGLLVEMRQKVQG